jgi:hypothetical protein
MPCGRAMHRSLRAGSTPSVPSKTYVAYSNVLNPEALRHTYSITFRELALGSVEGHSELISQIDSDFKSAQVGHS